MAVRQISGILLLAYNAAGADSTCYFTEVGTRLDLHTIVLIISSTDNTTELYWVPLTVAAKEQFSTVHLHLLSVRPTYLPYSMLVIPNI